MGELFDMVQDRVENPEKYAEHEALMLELSAAISGFFHLKTRIEYVWFDMVRQPYGTMPPKLTILGERVHITSREMNVCHEFKFYAEPASAENPTEVHFYDFGPWWDDLRLLVRKFSSDVKRLTLADQRAKAQEERQAKEERQAELTRIAESWV